LINPNTSYPGRQAQKPLGVRLEVYIILLVVGLKLALKDEMDHVVQVLLDLACE
jgi:hypothetical protein